METIGGAGVAKTKYYINLTAEERDLLMRIVCEARIMDLDTLKMAAFDAFDKE